MKFEDILGFLSSLVHLKNQLILQYILHFILLAFFAFSSRPQKRKTRFQLRIRKNFKSFQELKLIDSKY